LLDSALDVDAPASELVTIPGAIPDPLRLPRGCPFHPRCPYAEPDCRAGRVVLRAVAPGRESACLHHERLLAGSASGAPGAAGRPLAADAGRAAGQRAPHA